MSIGLGIVLIVVGAILTFALNLDVPGLGEDTLGWILMLAGLLVALLTYARTTMRRSNRSVARTQHADGSETIAERRTERDGGPAV